MREEPLIFGRPYIDDSIIAEVTDCLRSGWWSTGPRVAKFEEGLAEYTGAKHCVALNSCTAGLHLSLLALDIGPGDEVITTPITFAATGNVIALTGATPVFVDVDSTGNIDPKKIEPAITEKTKAIIAVHLAGRPCAMDEIVEIAMTYGIVVIEDAAHALGAWYHGRHAGTLDGEHRIGYIGVFSFYVTKNLATGDGGALITDDNKLAERIRLLAHSGISRTAWDRFSTRTRGYNVIDAGYKYSMMDLQAAIGLAQLKKFDELQEKRNVLWSLYLDGLIGSVYGLPLKSEPDTTHARHLFQIRIPSYIERDIIQSELRANKIGSGIHFNPLHLEPFYRDNFGHKEGRLPVAERFGKHTLSLPLTPQMTADDVNDVVRVLLSVSKNYEVV